MVSELWKKGEGARSWFFGCGLVQSEVSRNIANLFFCRSLIIGGSGQAFAMFYIGVNQAVNPVEPGSSLNGNSIFAIICVYLFVVFYSFGWGPIPFVLSAECAVSSFVHGYLGDMMLTNLISQTTSVPSSWQPR